MMRPLAARHLSDVSSGKRHVVPAAMHVSAQTWVNLARLADSFILAPSLHMSGDVSILAVLWS